MAKYISNYNFKISNNIIYNNGINMLKCIDDYSTFLVILTLYLIMSKLGS